MGLPRRARSPICLTIEVDSDPVAGYITWPGHVELEFLGWLELLVILEALHRGKVTESACDEGHDVWEADVASPNAADRTP